LSAHNVVDFIAFCPDNPGSMLNTISRAREDGNGTLPNSIFIELNKLYLKIKESDTKTVLQKLGLHEFLTEIINANLLVCGMIDKHWVY
ncbi:MAG: alpha-E domain-containing protein, partial [bacterium]